MKSFPSLQVIFLIVSAYSNLLAQNIYTVAGGGWGDNGAATNAVLFFPSGVTIDNNGNIYIADYGNYKVRKVNPQGIITSVAGNGSYPLSDLLNFDYSGQATNAFIRPSDVLLDDLNNLYILSSNVILKVDLLSGVITRIGGSTPGYTGDNGSALNAKFRAPKSFAIDQAGNLYVADTDNHVIRKIEISTGIVTTIIGNGVQGYSGDGGLSNAASLNFPNRIFIDDSNDIYISDTGNNVIRKVNSMTSVITTIAGNGISGYSGDNGSAINAQLNGPTGLIVNSSNLYIVDTGNDVIRKLNLTTGLINTFAGTGVKGYTGDNGLATNASFNSPAAIKFDNLGNLYIGDRGNLVVRKIRTNGIISTIAGNGSRDYGGENGLAIDALINPQGMTFDADGNMLIADWIGVRKVDKFSKKIVTIAGNGTTGYTGDNGSATAASFGTLGGITLDNEGNIYISDSQFDVIRKIQVSTGIITTIAGNSTKGYTGDNGLATNAQLNQPNRIKVNKNNELYFSDRGNHVIRKINLVTGIISTVAGNGISGYSGNGGLAINASLNLPDDLAFDKNEIELYFSEGNSHVIRKVNLITGIISLVSGQFYNGGFQGDGDLAINAKFIFPFGLCLDEMNNIYIADSGNNRIRKITAITGIISTIAGTGAGYSGFSIIQKNGVASDMIINFPKFITLDNIGNVYFNEGTKRILKYITTANITGSSLPDTYDHSSTLTSSVTVDDASKAFFVNLKSKGISEPESAWKTVAVTPSGNKFETSVTPNDPIGVEYYYEVIDEASVKRESTKGRAYVRYPFTSSAQAIPNLRFGGEQKDYQIISVPLNLANKSVVNVFNDLAPADPTQWRLFTYDNTKTTNKTTDYKTGDIEPGKGYWLIARRFKEINPGEGTAVHAHTENPFTLNLTQGWNLIGNPYNFLISWQDILTANNNPPNVTGFHVFEGGALSISSTLDRYRGAFIYTPSTINLKVPVLRNTSLGGGREKNSDTGNYESEQQWDINFTLTDGNLTNKLCGIGMHPQGSEGEDTYDRISFPLPEGMAMPELIFKQENSEQTFSKATVPSKDKYSWTMEVKQGNAPTTLRWETEVLFNNTNDYYLFDPTTSEVINMKERSSYTFHPTTKNLVLHYGNSDYIKQKLDNEIPTFGAPYPNPATEMVTIPMHISERMGKTRVKIEVYNSLGKRINVITDEEYTPGGHTIEWLLNQPLGLYILKMQADNLLYTSKVIVNSKK